MPLPKELTGIAGYNNYYTEKLVSIEPPMLLGILKEEWQDIASSRRLPEWFSKVYLGASFPKREEVIDILFDGYVKNDPRGAQWLPRFIRKVDDTLVSPRPYEQRIILKAVKLATVAHQYNLREEKRERQAEELPYIVHCLQVAELLLSGCGDGREGFDAITVAAGLLHDVPEDVDLGEGLNSTFAWFDLIREEFNHATNYAPKFGLDKNRIAGDLLMELVDGHTNKPLPTNSEELQALRNNPFHKSLTATVSHGGLRGTEPQKELSEKDIERIDEVVYNLGELFKRALVSPDHWRIFLLFIADSWQNLQTPQWVRMVKVLRGRIAAALADWLGWYEVRSEMIKMLTPLTNLLTPYSPLARPGQKPMPDDYKQIEKYLRFVPQIMERLRLLSDNQSISCRPFWGWPIVYADKPYDEGVNGSCLPLPEVIIEIPRNDFQMIASTSPATARWLISRRPAKGDGKYRQLNYSRHKSDASGLATGIFRGRLDFVVKISGRKSFMFRIQSNEPSIADLFCRGSQVNQSQIPEAGLFNNHLKDIDRAAWEFHLSSLIASLYELNLPYHAAQNVYPFFYGNKLIFVDGSHRLGDTLVTLGMRLTGSNLTVRRLYGVEFNLSLEGPMGGTTQFGIRRTFYRRAIVLPQAKEDQLEGDLIRDNR